MKNSTTHNEQLHFTIPSQTQYLHDVREFITNAATTFGFNEDETHNIVLAVDEACTNIIEHSYQYAKDKKIVIDVFLKKNSLEIIITDTGKKFEPDTIPTPNLEEYIQQRKQGGLGLFLIKKIMDTVEFSFQENKNILRMVKHRSS